MHILWSCFTLSLLLALLLPIQRKAAVNRRVLAKLSLPFVIPKQRWYCTCSSDHELKDCSAYLTKFSLELPERGNDCVHGHESLPLATDKAFCRQTSSCLQTQATAALWAPTKSKNADRSQRGVMSS